jgi:hypothetical protein
LRLVGADDEAATVVVVGDNGAVECAVTCLPELLLHAPNSATTDATVAVNARLRFRIPTNLGVRGPYYPSP